MKKSIYQICIVLLLFATGRTQSQPIPVELMTGYRYVTVNLVVSKSFTPTSRFGFFHMNTIGVVYDNKEENDFSMQDLFTYEPLKNFRITGGAFYGKPGFKPTLGMQYLKPGKKLFILVAPRVNIESEPAYDIFTIVQFKTPLSEKTKLYSRLQLLNLFDSGGNIKSYQWFRLGLEIKGVQFGAAFNLDEFGQNPEVQYNAGLFIRREIP
jgi:hypothetical protein